MPDGKCCRGKTFIIRHGVADSHATTRRPLADAVAAIPWGISSAWRIHESCHGLDHGKQAFARLPRRRVGWRDVRTGETAALSFRAMVPTRAVTNPARIAIGAGDRKSSWLGPRWTRSTDGAFLQERARPTIGRVRARARFPVAPSTLPSRSTTGTRSSGNSSCGTRHGVQKVHPGEVVQATEIKAGVCAVLSESSSRGRASRS
jgi:hypothetical protein